MRPRALVAQKASTEARWRTHRRSAHPLSHKVKTKSCRISEFTRLPLGALTPRGSTLPRRLGLLGGSAGGVVTLGAVDISVVIGESGLRGEF